MDSGIMLVAFGLAAGFVLIAAMAVVIGSVGVAAAGALYAATLALMCGIGFGPPLIPTAFVGLSLATFAAMFAARRRRTRSPVIGVLYILDILDKGGPTERSRH